MTFFRSSSAAAQFERTRTKYSFLKDIAAVRSDSRFACLRVGTLGVSTPGKSSTIGYSFFWWFAGLPKYAEGAQYIACCGLGCGVEKIEKLGGNPHFIPQKSVHP